MTRLTTEHKQAIASKIEEKKDALGTYSAVATFCNVSESVISQMKAGTYTTKGDAAWLDIANKLGWKPESTMGKKEWVIVETRDYKNIHKIVSDAKNQSMFMAISDIGGAGKSAPLKDIAEKNKANNIFYIECLDWGKREFLESLCQLLGIDITRGYKTPNKLLELVIDFFQRRKLQQPLLIVDQANDLKDSAKRIFIPLYNRCEDTLGVVVSGTENLEDEIKKGIRFKKKGFDEIDSRFGRKYLTLLGNTKEDATKICQANGVTDKSKIDSFFEECNPIRKIVKIEGKEVLISVTKDLRRLKRLVRTEQLKALTV